MKGLASVPVIANNYYRMNTPQAPLDMVPEITLRYLAVASGGGWFGLSDNVITPNEGAAVILGGVVIQNPDGSLEAVSPVEAKKRRRLC